MKVIISALVFFACAAAGFAQTISCNLTKLNALDFFIGGDYIDTIVWPESTVAEIEASINDSITTTDALQFLPLAMVEMNNYFKTGITQDRFYKIIRYSKLFAATLRDSSWLIGMNNFCGETNQMIERFNAWYDNDTAMANLLFTFDRGPYFGKPYGQDNTNGINVTDSIQFTGTSNKLYIGLLNEKHILFVKDAAGNSSHVFQILEDYNEDDVRTLFSEVKCVRIEDFGFSTLVFLSDGVCRLYFNEDGRLRFYYIL